MKLIVTGAIIVIALALPLASAGAVRGPALVAGHSTSANRATGQTAHVCPYQVSVFVDSLTEIRGRLNGLGLSRNQLGEFLNEASVAYDRVPWSRVRGGCLSEVGVPGERAYNNYAKSYNAWGACIRKLTFKCPDGTVNAYWRMADANVERAINWLG